MAKQLISADSLHATYLSELVLEAEGQVSQGVYDIHFERVPWIGGLKFKLVARFLLGPPGEKVYKHRQTFPIVLPSMVYPSGDVIIVTANYPKGKVVRIEGLRKGDLPSTQSDSKATDLEADEPLTQAIKPGDTRYVVLGGELKVTEKVPDPSKGYVNMDFDKHYLQLAAMNIDDGDITLTFKAIQLGTTPITLSGGTHGIPSAWLVQINVFIFNNSLISPPPDKIDASEITTSVPNEFYSFKEKILTAQSKVRETYPDANLKIAEASKCFLDGGNVYQLTALRATFTSIAKHSTITIENDGTALNNWPYPPVVITDLLIGVRDVDMTKLKVSLEEAGDIMEKHRFDFYSSMVLSEPEIATPIGDEPKYAFKLEDGRVCYVGAMSGSFTIGPSVGQFSKDEKTQA